MRLFRELLANRVYVLSAVVYLLVAVAFFGAQAEHRSAERATVHSVATRLASLQAAAKPMAPAAPVISGQPVSLAISRLGIQFPIADGVYNPLSRTWTLNSQHVFIDSYGGVNTTVSTNQSSNVLIYGHNFDNVLGKTKELVPGDILTLTTKNGYRFEYYYTHDAAVVPTQTDILGAQAGNSPVLLMTCTGTWDQLRRVMYFAPLGQPQLIAQTASKGVPTS